PVCLYFGLARCFYQYVWCAATAFRSVFWLKCIRSYCGLADQRPPVARTLAPGYFAYRPDLWLREYSYRPEFVPGRHAQSDAAYAYAAGFYHQPGLHPAQRNGIGP